MPNTVKVGKEKAILAFLAAGGLGNAIVTILQAAIAGSVGWLEMPTPDQGLVALAAFVAGALASAGAYYGTNTVTVIEDPNPGD